MISTGDIGQALANDVEGTMLFISGCTDSERVIAKPHCSRSCTLDPFQNSDFVLDFGADELAIISNSGRFSSFLKTISSTSFAKRAY